MNLPATELSELPLRLEQPDFPARPDHAVLLSATARMVADGSAVTKADITRTLDIARSTANVVVDDLLERGLIERAGNSEASGRGRPGERLVIAPSFGTVLVADIGNRSTRVCVSDLSQQVRAARSLDIGFEDAPDQVLAAVIAALDDALDSSDCDPALVRCVAVGLPASIDIRSLPPVIRRPTNSLWDGFPVTHHLSRHFECPVILENDANLRAIAESRILPAHQLPLIYIKMGTGVGGGIIGREGRLQRGADGAAGEIGHIQVHSALEIRCSCGKYGCLQAIASESALLERIRSRTGENPSATTESNLTERLRSGDLVTAEVMHESALAIGEVVAALVQFHNPARVVLGGALIEANEETLAVVRSIVYRSAHPLATRNLYLGQSLLGRDGALIGGVISAIEHALSPDRISSARPGESKITFTEG
ncbi:ROK family transcriptional regulator [Herbiconiux ginsengi]|uniref:Sugar kinase of the NBD/HSP70 family, may contain an N-terminal HTH domain n=1 Tax=Herbiconiux ginsengi TaxID=381665 RepID=A0A1H3U137_9MICO|nr:ROK family transcriptional regulator [Herbiconiux ginsengi]SDZ56224.1 Sugar kinase of the NBD/HSP70 family, may contain an N-terminal HTH domain [Herbiconiux ginsengi]